MFSKVVDLKKQNIQNSTFQVGITLVEKWKWRETNNNRHNRKQYQPVRVPRFKAINKLKLTINLLENYTFSNELKY